MGHYRQFTSKSSLADMSLPPAQRGRKNKTKRAGTKGVIAQLSHANGQPRINERRREWEKQNRQRRKAARRQSETAPPAAPGS